MTGKYRTIVADPPWEYVSTAPPKRTRGMRNQHTGPLRAFGLPYMTMTVDEITALPVGGTAERDAHLYLWTTQRYMRASYDVLAAWGFSPVCLLIWCKEPLGWHLGPAFGSTVEFLHFARRGHPQTMGTVDRQWFTLPRKKGPPVRLGETRQREHSAKPEAFLDMIEQVSPGPYLELFARRQRLGWDTWGNEALEHVEMPA